MDGASDLVDDVDDQPFGAPIPRAFKLSDAERIAANRLDGAAEGSLKEALATKIVEPAAEGQSLAERLGQVASHAPDDSAPLRVFQAAPEVAFGWINAVPPAHAVPFFDAPETPSDAAQQTAELMPDACLDTSWVKEWSTLKDEQEVHVETVSLPEPAPSDVMDGQLQSSETAPEHEPAVAEMVAESAGGSVVADDVMPDDARAVLPADVEQAMPAVAGTVPAVVVEMPTIRDSEEHPGHALAADPKLEPIVTAFAASARLAADATAASQALHHLKKLLSEQLSEPLPGADALTEAVADAPVPRVPEYALPSPVVAEMQDPHVDARPGNLVTSTIRTEIPEVAVAVPAAPVRSSPPQGMPPPLPRMVSPEPIDFERPPALPQDVPAEELPKCVVGKAVAPSVERAPPQASANAPSPLQVRSVAKAESALPVTSSVKDVVRTQRQMMKKAPPPKPQKRQRRSFDFRGFAAGFALSGAIGLVLYFVISAS